jgi:exosortase/archaeosortase family protein
VKNAAVNIFLVFAAKFLAIFTVLNFGIKFLYGASIKGGFYSATIEHYFNIVRWLRNALMHSVSFLMSLFNFETTRVDEYTLRSTKNLGIVLVYQCLAVAVLSLWVAFVLANKLPIKQKIKWLIAGLSLIWLLNTVRIALVLYAKNKNVPFPLGIDHHTWFNLVAYLLLILLIYFFQKKYPLFPKTA